MSDEPSPITVPAGIPALEAATEAPHLSQPQVLIITGMSGAGRTRAAAVVAALAAPGVATDPVPESAGMLEA